MTTKRTNDSVGESLGKKVLAAIEEDRPIWRKDLTAAEFKEAKKWSLVKAGVIWDEPMRRIFEAKQRQAEGGR